MKLKPEEITQISVVKWLALQHPSLARLIIKIDNEGKRAMIGHVIAKRMGLHKGASDMFIAFPTKKYAGLWLEVKPDGWKPSKAKKEHLDNQWNFIYKMREVGYWADMGIGFDHCLAIINNYIASNG